MLKGLFRIPQLQRDPVACLKYARINNGPCKFCNYRFGLGSGQNEAISFSLEGKQNTIGVRAAGGEGRIQRPSFEQIAYHSAKALGINYLFNPASRPNGPSWNNFNDSATNLPIARNCWLYGLYEDYKYFRTAPRKKKKTKQNKTKKQKNKNKTRQIIFSTLWF